jgi:DNA-binding transcriptional MocR family regulator
LRIGFLVPPRKLLSRMSAMLRTTVWMTPPPMLECFRAMVENGDAVKVAKARLAESRARQTLATKALKGLDYQTASNSSHVWLSLPERWREHDVVAQARRRGLLVLGADAFAVTRNAGDGHVRLSLGSPPTRADLSRGIEILTDLLNEDPQVAGAYF